jgi:subtilisin family serine protease
MSLVHARRFCPDKQKDHHTRRSAWLGSMMALGLTVLLSLTPVPFSVSAQENGLTLDAEALLEAKADPLLESVRRAALADRAAEQDKFRQESLQVGGPARTSELEGLSKIAAIKRLPDGAFNVSLTVRLTGNSVAELSAAGFAVGAQAGDVATVETNVERLPELAALASVRKMSAATYSYPTNDLARQAIGVDDASGIRQLLQTGRGVIVGVIDTGIDFRHLDFTVPGTGGKQTRIKALLDMTIYNQQSSDWNYVLPGGFASIGHLYTEADINAALQLPASQAQNSDIVKERDKHGHGTFTAGIAAGNGLAGPQPGKYAGMAPEADLVIVKVSRNNTESVEISDSDIINAMKFIQQTAAEMGEPFVINMSLGSNVGSHDGTMDQERAIDEVVGSGPGRAFCVSTGNYGNMDVHASGNLPGGSVTLLNFDVSAGSTPQFFGLSYPRTDNLAVTLVRPDGVKIGPVSYTGNQSPGASNQYVDIYNSLDDKRDTDPQNDQKAVAIFFKSPAANLGSNPIRTWTVMLQTQAVSGGHFDAWIGGGKFTNFVDGSRRLSSSATARGAITVGGYVTRPGIYGTVGDYASYTGVGPTADGREKPDITTPSSFVYSAKSSVGTGLGTPLAPDSPFHTGAHGTSASAPVVAGGVALILQENPNLTSDQIKNLIKATATHDLFTGTSSWHERFGFGKFNVAEALRSIKAPTWEGVALSTSQAEIKTWTIGDRTYAYLKLLFPNGGYRVTNWGQAVRTGNDFSADASTERFTGASVQALTTTAQIYELGILSPGSYNFTFKNTGTVVKTLPFTVAAPPFPPNPIDAAREFVRQQYRDFLNREADQAGEDFWTDNITKCSDPARRPADQTEGECTTRQKETTSGAFFQSPEFRYTGYYVYRMYQGALGRRPKLSEFTPDAQFMGAGIIVNGQLSAARINQNKADFAQQFVNCTDATKYRCSEFKAIYDGLNNQQFVDQLFQTTGINASVSDRAELVNGLNAATETRASVLQKVVDGIVVISEGNQQFTTSYGQAFYNAESNRAFVQLEYFGYMKRDPDDAGYAFWLDKLNQFGGNFVNAEMVLAFISSPEYRARFGQP